MNRLFLLAAMAASIAPVSSAVAGQPHDPVVIEGAGNEFIVTEGAPALGCGAGTRFFAHGGNPPGMQGSFVAVMTCTVGGEGTITLNFEAANGNPGPDGLNNVGQWNVTGASGDFRA